MARLRFTAHAAEMIEERGIDPAWVEAAIQAPMYRQADPQDARLTRSFGRVAAAGDRMLRVVHRSDGEDTLVVTAHFDRGARR